VAQHDYEVSNASAAALRADVNLALQAIATNNSGATAPTVTFPYQWWADTSTGLLKQRNASNTDWITKGVLNMSGYPSWYRINSAVVGANVNTPQNLLGVGITLAAGVHEFECLFALAKTAGTTAHTLAIGFGGTAALNNIAYQLDYRSMDAATLPPAALSSAYISWLQSAAASVISGSISNANAIHHASIRGTVNVSSGGTFIPQYSLSSAPGGAYTTQVGSFMRIAPLGASGLVLIGDWS